MTDIEYEIVPPRRGFYIDWRELWRYRDLFLVFSWRDLSVRYKQTVMGVLWAVFQPLITMLLFTFIFNKVGKISSGDGTPYAIFAYVGLLFWQFYSGVLNKAAEGMVTNAAIIQKVYFPRLIIPASTAITGLADMGIAFIVMGGLMVYFQFPPQLLGLALLPVLLVSTILVSLGQGLICASLNIKYRDVKHALPFLIQIMMYVTPVIYPLALLDGYPGLKQLMLWLNPMSGIITVARAAFLGKSPVDFTVVWITLLMSVVYFILGVVYFSKTERYFADIV